MSTNDERRRVARARIREARRSAADALDARRAEVRRDLERRIREMSRDREAYHAT